MLHITEDTPVDMLTGAMDLTVHLPNGRSVKMSVKRSTPMMDLLMHISTKHNLQLSDHTLQALSMAPSADNIDRPLPFKPNTPIGLIDTQNIKVLPKPKTVKTRMAPQPFESTFRLKVHLPRNQLYVTRVSKFVMLEDILKKACEEKVLDPKKYALHHPGNLDEVLDPKLTLNDYQITEVYLVAKGTVNLNQAFSASDLMVLRKEEERKRMQAKTGGGVLSLIFGKKQSGMGSGSLSSENRSISPSHSDDSRSVTPPAMQNQIITPQTKEPEKPKAPQRKRRPAPKPPTQTQPPSNNNEKTQTQVTSRKNSDAKAPSSVADSVEKSDNNALTICHSRNSSDSSGYHEASILSDNCNTSLPRRPQSAYVSNRDAESLSKMRHSMGNSMSNLNKMSAHSKSTSSLAFPGRKKKAAPPPPPALKLSASVTNLVAPSPVVASQNPDTCSDEQILARPKPLPRKKIPRTSIQSLKEDEELNKIVEEDFKPNDITEEEKRKIEQEEQVVLRRQPKKAYNKNVDYRSVVDALKDYNEKKKSLNIDNTELQDNDSIISGNSIVEVNQYKNDNDYNQLTIQDEPTMFEQQILHNARHFTLGKPDKPKLKNSKSLPNIAGDTKPPEIVGVIHKRQRWNKFDTFGKRSCYKIGMSLVDEDLSSMESERASISSAMANFTYDEDLDSYNYDLFDRFTSRESKNSKMYNQLYGMHSHEPVESEKDRDMKKWNNYEDLDNLSQTSIFDTRNNLVNGGSFDTDSLTSTNYPTPLDSLASYLTHSEEPSKPETPEPSEPKTPEAEACPDVTPAKAEINLQELPRTPPALPENPPPKLVPNKTPKEEVVTKKEVVEEPKPEPEEIQVEVLKTEATEKVNETEEPKEVDWQYQLPPPPEGFRDAASIAEATINDATIDSVVTSPELFEKLKVLEETQSEPATVASSIVSEDEKPLLNNLSLENLEKRKSLVYNRELATSLKMNDKPREAFATSLNKFESTYEEIKRSSLTRDYTDSKPQITVKRSTSTLPNFKITPYNNPKNNITVFEDDTIRSNTYIKNNVTTMHKRETTNLSKSYMGRSMENISFRKNSWENQSDDDKSYNVYRPNQNMKFKNALANSLMYRSESFSNTHGPAKPVSRSKSTLTLNKYKEDKKECTSLENRSNSLLDVSGLQSLEVMKSIQNRLNTSVENLSKPDTLPKSKPEVLQEETPQPEVPPKVYQYRGPPSINLGTWSERPKSTISLKDDADYKLSNVSSKLIVNTTNNNITSNNSIEVNNKPAYTSNNGVNVRGGGYQSESKIVTIKVNGTEPISTEKSGNVVIKIGSSKPLESQKFVSAVGYRKPLGNVNKINQRPHSIAFDDLSHVPVVRSVELKKPYKDMTSVTQINQGTNNYSNTYKSEVVPEPKPVNRVNSYVGSYTPIVRGFKGPENMNTPRNRLSWNPVNPNIFDLNNKPKESESYSTNKDVPFSQSNLRRTDSKKLLQSEQNDAKINIINNQKNTTYNNITPPKKVEVMQAPHPPPPSLPKFEAKKPRPRQIQPQEDPRDLLLDSIRNFGGKKGLKSIKG